MPSTNCVLILNALVKDQKVKKLLLTIHITILNKISKTRSLLKLQKKVITNDVIIKKINTKLREIIRVNFWKHLRHKTLKTFKKNFCINDTLCSVTDNNLTIYFSETKKTNSLFNSREEPAVSNCHRYLWKLLPQVLYHWINRRFFSY